MEKVSDHGTIWLQKFLVSQKIFRLTNMQVVYTDMPRGYSPSFPHLFALFPSPLPSHSSIFHLFPYPSSLPYLFILPSSPVTTLLFFSPPSPLFYCLPSITSLLSSSLISLYFLDLFLSLLPSPLFDYLPESPFPPSSVPSSYSLSSLYFPPPRLPTLFSSCFTPLPSSFPFLHLPISSSLSSFLHLIRVRLPEY